MLDEVGRVALAMRTKAYDGQQCQPPEWGCLGPHDYNEDYWRRLARAALVELKKKR